MPPLLPSPLWKPHTNTHTHSRFCSNHHRQPYSQSVLSKHSWRYTIEVFLLTYPTPLLPNPHPHIQDTLKKKKKRNSTEPQLCKNLVCVQGMFLLKSSRIPPRNTDLNCLWMILFEYLRQAFVFLPSNLLLLWVRVLGFYHSNINSLFPQNPFLLRRGPSLWCLKVVISLKRLWLPG